MIASGAGEAVTSGPTTVLRAADRRPRAASAGAGERQAQAGVDPAGVDPAGVAGSGSVPAAAEARTRRNAAPRQSDPRDAVEAPVRSARGPLPGHPARPEPRASERRRSGVHPGLAAHPERDDPGPGRGRHSGQHRSAGRPPAGFGCRLGLAGRSRRSDRTRS